MQELWAGQEEQETQGPVAQGARRAERAGQAAQEQSFKRLPLSAVGAAAVVAEATHKTPVDRAGTMARVAAAVGKTRAAETWARWGHKVSLLSLIHRLLVS